MNSYLKFVGSIMPAVVNIHAQIPTSNPSSSILGTERMGTGTLLDRQGHILTIGYIVLGAESITVNLHDGRSLPAELSGQNVESGLAVIRALGESELEEVRTPRLGHSQDLNVGQSTLIIAATDKEQRQVSTGIITSLKPFDAYWEYMLDRAILTSASNPGFGGGPLLTYSGQLVGVVSLNLGPSGGLSLAVPVDLFYEAREELLGLEQAPRPARPWIGFFPQPQERDGLVIAGLVPGSPAEEAGLQTGDILLTVNNEKITSRRQLYECMWRGRAGDIITLTVKRGEEELTVIVASTDRKTFYGQS
ncbi:MAG: S1C family serine protease [Nitrospinota bacterium]